MEQNNTTNQIAVTSNEISVSTKVPWSYWTMVVAALVGGIPSGFLIAWQNLKRINKEKEAKEMLLSGAIVWIAVVCYNLITGNSEFIIVLLMAYLPIHIIWDRHLKNWSDNQAKPKFSLDVFKWSIIGILIQIPVIILATYIWK